MRPSATHCPILTGRLPSHCSDKMESHDEFDGNAQPPKIDQCLPKKKNTPISRDEILRFLCSPSLSPHRKAFAAAHMDASTSDFRQRDPALCGSRPEPPRKPTVHQAAPRSKRRQTACHIHHCQGSPRDRDQERQAGLETFRAAAARFDRTELNHLNQTAAVVPLPERLAELI